MKNERRIGIFGSPQIGLWFVGQFSNEPVSHSWAAIGEAGRIFGEKYPAFCLPQDVGQRRVEVLEHVSFVMKGGKVYKDELAAARPVQP
jgi:hypothetical protein